MNRMVVLIATFFLATAATAQDSTGNSTHSSCDFNQDGQVDESEKRECDAAYQKCDANSDGRVNETEYHECSSEQESSTDEEHEQKTTEENETEAEASSCVGFGTHEDHCESDTEADHEDSYHYEEGDPAAKCDQDGDGNVTREEWENEDCRDAVEAYYEAEARKEREEAIKDAEARGLLGGSFKISDRLEQELETAEGVKVRIQHDSANRLSTESASSGVKVTFDAELDEGRTFIIDIDREVFGNSDLMVRYFVLDEQSGVELESTIQQASSLQDILDPGDDDNAAEYWLVEDDAGLHVMVSIPHWSVHSVALEADSSGSVGAPGPATPLILAGLATVAIIARRRMQ